MIKKHRLGLGSIFIILFIFFSLCPFILPIMSSDVQPYAFVLGFLLLILQLSSLQIDKTVVIFTSFAIITLFLFLITGSSNNSAKLFYGYFSFSIVTLASYFINCQTSDTTLKKTIVVIIFMWFLVGLYQTFINRFFIDNFVSNARTTSERGVYGLASEPSFYGVQCFYFFFLTRMYDRKIQLYLIAAIVCMAFFFAQSFLGVIFVVIWLTLFVIDSRNKRWIFLSIILTIIALIYISSYDNGGRLYFFLDDLLNGGGIEIADDESTNVRLNSISRSWSEVSYNYFMPQGFDKRYGSLIGDFLLSWGVIGIPYIIFIIKKLGSVYSGKRIQKISCIFFFLLLNSNIQIANPTFAFVLGYILSLPYKKQINQHANASVI